MIAFLWALPKYVFYVVLVVFAVSSTFNYTPFFRPPGVDAGLLNSDRLQDSYGEEYLRKRQRFHVRMFAVLALAYALMSAAYAVLPRLFPNAVPKEYQSRR